MSEDAGTKQQKENELPKEQLETAKKWLQLVAQARADKTLKQRLIDTPVVVLREHGINVRDGLDIRVVENTDKIAYLKLPAEAELADVELDRIVGGANVDAASAVETLGNIFGKLGCYEAWAICYDTTNSLMKGATIYSQP